ncbi:MAG: 16S rRNA processing protein RimM [Myxococcales bacterium]|nr:16S rRNA processing protein RimM [Myxococcales bacterium]
MQTSFLQIGTVLRPHGLQGELRIRLHNPVSTALDQARRIWLRLPALSTVEAQALQQPREWQIEAARRLPDGCYLVSLTGLVDRNDAETWRAAQLLVRRDELEPLEENEVYLADLVGMRVQSMAGDDLGRVKAVLGLNSNWLLSIERHDGSEILLPAVSEILKGVDLEVGLISADPPDGLLAG